MSHSFPTRRSSDLVQAPAVGDGVALDERQSPGVVLDVHGQPQRQITEQEILERCLYAQINEGAKILEEHIAIRPSDIDIVWINGYGWPVYRGGPMFYADTVGLKEVVAKLEAYGDKLGKGFSISPLLKQLASEGKRFGDIK